MYIYTYGYNHFPCLLNKRPSTRRWNMSRTHSIVLVGIFLCVFLVQCFFSHDSALHHWFSTDLLGNIGHWIGCRGLSYAPNVFVLHCCYQDSNWHQPNLKGKCKGLCPLSHCAPIVFGWGVKKASSKREHVLLVSWCKGKSTKNKLKVIQWIYSPYKALIYILITLFSGM